MRRLALTIAAIGCIAACGGGDDGPGALAADVVADGGADGGAGVVAGADVADAGGNLLQDSGAHPVDAETVDEVLALPDTAALTDTADPPDAAPDTLSLEDTPAGDAAPPDGDSVDSADSGPPAPDVGENPGLLCDLGDPGDDDRPRVVLVGHPFTAKPGAPGKTIRSMSLEPGGMPVDDGVLLDVGVRPARIAFVPSGSIALVVGEDGDVVSVSVEGAQDLTVVDSVKLPSADYGDIAISQDGTVAWVVGLNVNETSGVSVVHIGCDGALSVDTSGFCNVRLAESIAALPGEQTAVLLGGQTVFAPKDPDDVRLLGRNGDAWVEIGAFDVFKDFVNTGRIAASPDGSRVLVPNSSAFSFEEGDISVLAIGDGVLTEVDRITTLSAVSEALFSPDGLTALISRPEVNRVAILSDLGSGLAVTGEIKGIGLADQMALVDRGSSEGLVLIPSVDVNGGPNVAVLRIDGVGVVTDLGQVELGTGSEAIPDAIAVMR